MPPCLPAMPPGVQPPGAVAPNENSSFPLRTDATPHGCTIFGGDDGDATTSGRGLPAAAAPMAGVRDDKICTAPPWRNPILGYPEGDASAGVSMADWQRTRTPGGRRRAPDLDDRGEQTTVPGPEG
ncbi:hypothetical protein E2562_019731 [Oryza meyeriana var. granulata]|uniref:Uncharacterized protein n=1 Tax=Oryza meyeriana var. granulata TaxID=110450 RepID=A0A6G1C7Q7_9ORYZ|nr:hypothetical protein E2562_019731 [Oryza meyeriana var. granulata]